MVAITATNSATPSPQAGPIKVRLRQPLREADQVEGNPQTLRSKADAAEVASERSQLNVRGLSVRSQQADATYMSQLKAGKSAVPQRTKEFLVDMYTAASDKFAASGNALKTDPKAPPVVNAQGHTTGRIMDVRA
jgi:hypothetical protein